MFLRNDLDLTLDQMVTLLDQRDDGTAGERVAPNEVEFHLDAADPTLKIKSVEIPASEENMARLGDFLSIPTAFGKRVRELTTGETQNRVFSEILANTITKDMEIKVHSTGEFIAAINEWGKAGIRPNQLAHAAQNAFPDGAEVKIARLIDETHEFAFDAYLGSTDFRTEGIGGDPEVNDITSGGLRFEVNLKQGLAPSVQPFMYRLICTNGMEASRFDLKVDARGQTIDAVLASIEENARIAFAGIENQINHFYDMRNIKVDNPERALRAIAR